MQLIPIDRDRSRMEGPNGLTRRQFSCKNSRTLQEAKRKRRGFDSEWPIKKENATQYGIKA